MESPARIIDTATMLSVSTSAPSYSAPGGVVMVLDAGRGTQKGQHAFGQQQYIVCSHKQVLKYITYVDLLSSATQQMFFFP